MGINWIFEIFVKTSPICHLKKNNETCSILYDFISIIISNLVIYYISHICETKKLFWLFNLYMLFNDRLFKKQVIADTI